jgi:hypothetical protein
MFRASRASLASRWPSRTRPFPDAQVKSVVPPSRTRSIADGLMGHVLRAHLQRPGRCPGRRGSHHQVAASPEPGNGGDPRHLARGTRLARHARHPPRCRRTPESESETGAITARPAQAPLKGSFSDRRPPASARGDDPPPCRRHGSHAGGKCPPAASAPATAKQVRGGGTVVVPTTPSAVSSRLRSGIDEPHPQARCRADGATSTPAVILAVIRIR